MFIVVLLLFGLCWLPYHTYFIYTYYHVVMIKKFCSYLYFFCSQAFVSQSYTQHVFLLFFWLAMANSAVNPVIYFLMNAK